MQSVGPRAGLPSGAVAFCGEGRIWVQPHRSPSGLRCAAQRRQGSLAQPEDRAGAGAFPLWVG
ncbi:hypothetical protein SCH4B_0638 [Ruegeria sp. TrichCH4B]|nr:hypothetical protein SCH4B_0638 [Ruegeria sp. TrichCH4B]